MLPAVKGIMINLMQEKEKTTCAKSKTNLFVGRRLKGGKIYGSTENQSQKPVYQKRTQILCWSYIHAGRRHCRSNNPMERWAKT
jgi:hypothetical protein